jgi:hypothetical protein
VARPRIAGRHDLPEAHEVGGLGRVPRTVSGDDPG